MTSPGIAAARKRRAARQSKRQSFYGKYRSASERRQARSRGETPKVTAVRGGGSKPKQVKARKKPAYRPLPSAERAKSKYRPLPNKGKLYLGGVDPRIDQIIGKESSWRVGVRSKSGKYQGLGQLGPEARRRYGQVTGDAASELRATRDYITNEYGPGSPRTRILRQRGLETSDPIENALRARKLQGWY